MPQVDDLSRSLTAFDQDSTLIAVIEMSLTSWLVAGIVPGVSRAPLKKLAADEDGVLRLLHRWRDEATKAGRHTGLTGSPDESGSRRREKGLARAGNGRVRRGMIQLAWRFLRFQGDSALATWYHARTQTAPNTRKKMIVALARKLLIALWRLATTGTVPEGVALRAMA